MDNSISGFLLLSFGILVFISNDGGFSMLSYGVKRIFLVFKKDPRMENFYEYKKKRLEKPAPFKYLLVVGSIYFFIAIIFLIILKRPFNLYSNGLFCIGEEKI